MADVFVSYARGDQQLARVIAEHLTSAGFTVWWDSELLPHGRFANVIEEQIHLALAVLVIWSRDSARSPWVRAEAELGRTEGKLIQVSVDGYMIPLPFNQYQAADLTRWHGNDSHPQWRKVLASVAHFAGVGEESRPTLPPPTRASSGMRRFQPGTRKLSLAGLVAVALTGGGLALLRISHPPESRGARIAVQPFRTIGGTSELSDFAAGLSTSLDNVLTEDQLQTLSPNEVDTLKGEDVGRRAKELGVGLTFTGTLQKKGGDIDVEMRLDDPVQHATLWTAEISGPATQSDQLQARVGALTVAVLNCSAQALGPNVKISDPGLQAFLHACELSQTATHGLAGTRQTYAMLDAMRQAAREAPDFAAAHSVLAKHLAFVAAYHRLENVNSIREEAASEARRALELDPKDPDGFVALGLLAPPGDFAKRESLFRRALALNPSWPHANGFLGNVMTDIGRLREAAALYQRAAAVNPQSTDWASVAAGGLVRIGDTRQADSELARLSQLWPNDPVTYNNQLESMIAQKRWSDASKLLDRAIDFPDYFSSSWTAQWRDLFSALQSNNSAVRQSARKSLLASASTDPRNAIYGLCLLGFVDDAFLVALGQMDVDATREDDSSFMFHPQAEALRRDRRFMLLAARFGLVDYWRQTGHWPDLCQDPQMQFNCAQEAAAEPVM